MNELKKVIKLGFTNCFLLEAKKGYLLIDTSYPNKYQDFVKKLQKAAISVKDINYILLTHHHDDHAGFVTELKKDSNAAIIVHQKALPFLEQGRSEEESKPLNFCTSALLSVFSIFHKFVYPPLEKIRKEDIILVEDDFDILERELDIDGVILHTPGHTKDSISVVLDDGSAFVGDVAMNFFNFCRIKYRPIVVQNLEEVFTSWEKILDHGAKKIYPAHGKPFSAERLLFYKNKLQKKL